MDSNTEALITLKETIEGKYRGNKIYTLELEGLENVAKLESAQPRTLAKHSTSSRNTHDWDNVTPDVKPESNSTTDKALLSKRNESEVSLVKQGIDEVSLVKAQKKFNYDEKKASDLLGVSYAFLYNYAFKWNLPQSFKSL